MKSLTGSKTTSCFKGLSDMEVLDRNRAWTGELQLELSQKQNRTVSENVFFEGAFKVMQPIYLDHTGQLTYYLLNPGGGYLGGDTYSMDIRLNEEAYAILTTQSATKVYKTPGDHAYQYGRFSLGPGSLLEYTPDPLIVYREGVYQQHQQFYMDPRATLLSTDIITPGWSPSGKHFSYDKVDVLNEVFIDGQLEVMDRFVLEPNKKNVASYGHMEGYSHLGSMMMISPFVTDGIIESLHDLVDHKEINFGLSRTPVPGLSLRVLANRTQDIEEVFTACQNYIRRTLFDASPVFLRKY
ncbi:urease accessory protein UreD [Virgibacillus xinjiangensis]|uniref:Urease accessory protein UreD n=1 Tax=Virgibacillus xinjiangensis TaxID=393090 RepID=A0ABV7CU56_9BACI